MYSEKISRAYKCVTLVTMTMQRLPGPGRRHRFVPQANRSLRPLNMHLNTRTSTGFNWFKRQKPVKRSEATSPARNPKEEPERPTSPTGRQAIPLANNPRGELIFSNRVDGTFREGYEKYRADWERRRAEKPAATTADGSPSVTQRRTYSSKTGESIDWSSLSQSQVANSRDSSPSSSRSPSPEYGHSRPSSGASTSGPPSPRSLHSAEDLPSAYPPFTHEPTKPEYEEFFDSEHQIRV
jgi:hypothetical protein